LASLNVARVDHRRALANDRSWRKADVQPDDRCSRNFVSAICIAATVIFWL
jgi:hypothetical protein